MIEAKQPYIVDIKRVKDKVQPNLPIKGIQFTPDQTTGIIDMKFPPIVVAFDGDDYGGSPYSP
jgi:hypothetical protein